jgi:hypothetical protein
MTKQIVVRGKAITPALITAFARRLNSTDEIITQWANGAMLELVQNQNGNWLYDMFDCRAFRLANGGLNKLGMEVYQYAQAHYPRLTYDKETMKIGLKKYNPDSPLATNFVSVGDSEISADLQIIEVNEKFYRPHGDFALTFTEYKAFKAEKVKGADEDNKPVQAKSLVKALEKAIAAQSDSLLIGAPLELVDLLANLGTLANAVQAQISASNKADIDAALVKLRDAEDRANEATARAEQVRATTQALALTPAEIQKIKDDRAAQQAASAANAAQAETRKPTTRQSRNKAAQALAETALTGEIKAIAESPDAIQPQAKDVA